MICLSSNGNLVKTVLKRHSTRRGGHLWILCEKPLSGRHCRLYICRLKVPVKGAGLAEGIEVFPRQDELEPGQFGNAIHGPLGVHRATGKRYWFYGADYTIEDQLRYLEGVRKVTESELLSFTDGLEMPPEFQPKPSIELHPTIPSAVNFES